MYIHINDYMLWIFNIKNSQEKSVMNDIRSFSQDNLMLKTP